jgi:molybdate transport system substrate-binding protein
LIVPAGTYAKEYLVRRGLWTKVSDRVVPTVNVRAALAAVESGNVEVRFVFKPDVAISRKVKVLLEVPQEETSPIIYPAAITRDAPQAEAAARFLDYLASPAAMAVFRKFGFAVPPAVTNAADR